ncbi:triacylglycerol lipase family protein [Aspergillus saccharolyticus JOP 1030-1]|uniref:Patatin-like serine hydrolase n=1 Tax=Aspergillus saccharolyticus JOP 1030-1 TaxID=1450539 RepID=A0A318Z7A1_9EURO|nr:patatin-like serine hydrolase [Aspergillus saccharolyticus JOP 1030-1]PYH40613.1 patatin-like serine hydrolase [Aspergillus saccharolyticus JOP 1030-1]
MASLTVIYDLFTAVFSMILDVAQFWKQRLWSWWNTQSPLDRLRYALENATTYEEWEEAAFDLDELLSKDLWRQNPTSRHYDYRLILGRLEALMRAREEEDILTLVNLLRSGLLRNLGNITSPKLFTQAYAGTKLLIDDYITQVALSIQQVTALPTAPVHISGFGSQAKLELLHDTRQAFGRTTLLLQGGSIFGLCHLGVVKALHLRGLLPRIIIGTATGALIAALVGVHTEDELLTFLDSDGIDLSAFDRRRKPTDSGEGSPWLPFDIGDNWAGTLLRRIKRYIQKGYFLDAEVLEECVRANLGDLTFEEAYARSKRILNITVATSNTNATPNLLNYLTAPNVLIWSAAVASNASNTSLYRPVTIYCKDETGSIVPWPHSQDATFASWRHVQYSEGESPLSRVAELFNVNHFIVSQARPYLIPFLRSDGGGSGGSSSSINNNNNILIRRPASSQPNPAVRYFTRLVMGEIRHRFRQLDYLGLLPTALARIVLEESIPGPSITLVPDLTLRDFTKIFENPSKESLAHWSRKGERGVWPAVSALKVRCVIEIELDKGYQVVRRRRPADMLGGSGSLVYSGGGVAGSNGGSVGSVFGGGGGGGVSGTGGGNNNINPRRAVVPNEGLPRRRRSGNSNNSVDPGHENSLTTSLMAGELDCQEDSTY